MRPLSFLAALAGAHTGAVVRPRWCTYLVTMRCNARCVMCDAWRLRPGLEISPDAAARVFAKLGRLDVVRFTGGEPFLREDLGALARAVDDASRPSVLHITTNGSMPEVVECFAASFPRPRALRIMVSFDGLPGEHDANRGPAATFSQAEDTVRRLVRLGSRRGVRVHANHTVISPRSMTEAQALRDRLRSLGVELGTVLAYSDSATYGRSRQGSAAEDLIVPRGYPLHPKLSGCNVIGFVEEEIARLDGVRETTLRLGKRYYLRGLLSRLRNDARPRPRPRCVALGSHLRLLPDGFVPICQFNSQVVGNLVGQELDQLVSSQVFQQARRWVDACPGCWAECETIPNAIYTGDILSALLPFRPG